MKKCTQTPQRLFGASANSQISIPNEITFTPKEYAEVLHSLLEDIGERSYFSGTVTTQHREFTSHLKTTLIIYRDRTLPELPVSDFVPVWWEMSTTCENNEVFNDFSLATLREEFIVKS